MRNEFGILRPPRTQPKVKARKFLRAFVSCDIDNSSAKCIDEPVRAVESELRAPRGTMFAEAVTAINGAVILRFEGHFGFLAAVRADDGKHLPLFAAFAVALTFVAAVAATHRLVFEALFGVEFLFARAEDEFFSAVFAHEGFVFKSH